MAVGTSGVLPCVAVDEPGVGVEGAGVDIELPSTGVVGPGAGVDVPVAIVVRIN